jgi:tetratricopeptide (TPR) repeat protein
VVVTPTATAAGTTALLALWALAAPDAAVTPGPDAAAATVAATATAPAPGPVPAVGGAARADPAAAQRDWEAGLTKLRADEVGDALELLKSANAKDPDNAAIANDLGFALMKLGARREAEAFFRRALTLDPRRALAYVNLAELVADSPERWQRQDEILALLKKGSALLRDDPRARTLIGLGAAAFEQRVGRLAEARRRLEEIVAQKPAAGLRKRALDQLAAVADQERALVLADWPEPPPSAQTSAGLREVDALLADGKAGEALTRATALSQSAPAATAVRFARARALEESGRYDQATRELTVLLQLRPSYAEAWRLLGMILAQHGGVLEADRADQALRRALALEPSWDDLRALRRRVAERRATDNGPRPAPPRPPPSVRAQGLFEEAQRSMGTDAPESARTALAQALADSPAFVEAAASFFSLTGQVPAPTVQALWDDGESLIRLAGEALRARPEESTTALVRPWLDRAVALGSAEAFFQRALLRADEADNAGALADLVAYVGADVNPPHLAEARALRRNLETPGAGRGSTVALARELLLSDRPRDAARVLGGPCRAGLAADTLVQLGRIEEYEGRPREALACHRLALAADPSASGGGRDALDRIARIAARGTPAAAHAVDKELQRGVGLQLPAAVWALARLARADEQWDEAVRLGDRFLSLVSPGDPLRAEAAVAVDSWRRGAGADQAARATLVRRSTAGGIALLVVLLGAFAVRRLRGRTVTAALIQVPDLFPDVAAAVGEIRHDIIKHRTSALSLLGESVTAREEIQRALTEPVSTSAAVCAIYERLRRAAAAAGVGLRPLDREPIFGPLVRALARAESLIGQAGTGREIAAVDKELRERHGPALAGLLALAPATPLDPARLAELVDTFTPDGLKLAVALPTAADVELPLTEQALHTILSNLLRNAMDALRGSANPQLAVKVREDRDATGRRMISMVVADSARGMVTLEEIDGRDGQRGLGLVRDLVRRWGGHLVVLSEAPPLVKGIGAVFPLPAAGHRKREGQGDVS